MAYKRKGIIARPGIHRRLDGTEEVVTWEELKEAVQFQRDISLVLHHPIGGAINPKDRIGRVIQEINEKEQVIEGDFLFFEEKKYWDQIPLDLRRKIVGGDAISLSTGYKIGAIVDGRQTSRQYDHIALDVKNPMQNVGIEEGSVRMEELPENFRIEETPEIIGDKKTEPTLPAKTEPFDPVNLGITIGKMQAQIDALNKQIAEKEQEKKDSPTQEKQVVEPAAEPEKTTTPDPPKPKTTVPAGASSQKKDGPDEDGRFRIVVE